MEKLYKQIMKWIDVIENKMKHLKLEKNKLNFIKMKNMFFLIKKDWYKNIETFESELNLMIKKRNDLLIESLDIKSKQYKKAAILKQIEKSKYLLILKDLLINYIKIWTI